jgi:predicted RNA binding protein YcfA (HicA-like mRNA interferase family)
MANTYSYSKLIKLLLQHDDRFEVNIKKGKGSHRVLYHPDINGRAASYPLKYHGEKTVVAIGHLSAIIRRFNLDKNFFK